MCRGLTQLGWAHHPAARPLRARLDELSAGDEGERTPYARGWIHRARGELVWLLERDVGACLAELDASRAAFEQGRALRALCLTQLNAASLTAWSGATARALAMLPVAFEEAERLGATFLVRYGRAVEGLLMAYAGDPRAEASMRAALSGVRGSPRLAFISRFVTAWLALERGDLDLAADDAREALALSVDDRLRGAAIALEARVDVAAGRLDAAITRAIEADALESQLTGLDLPYGVGGLALAEAHAARGEGALADAALGRVVARLDAVAHTLGAPEAMARFAARKLPNARIASLARERGVRGIGDPEAAASPRGDQGAA
ncbi:MAG TPA: hypothetical protein VGM56_23880 [Byssovorax sp.]|jgi:hypothetical protein